MTGMADQVGHDGARVMKKYEFQLQAAGTRFSLIYSAAGRYGASQIHSYFRQKIQLFYQSTIFSNLFDKSAVLFA